MKRFVSAVLLFAFLLPTLSLAQTNDAAIKRVELGLLPPVLIKGDPSWSITDRMKFHKVPGVTVAVIKDFKIAWAKAYGVKDVDTNEPVTTETLFQAGSISKSVNAMVAMKKVEEGRISLDENINTKLTSWKLPENELTTKNKVTLRRLLSHTAGLTVHGFPGYAINETIPTLPQVLDGATPANTAAVRVDLEPGTRYRYSGGGTTISQLALMDIEKKPYPLIALETVLSPLNMTNSTYSQPLPADWRKKAATGYRTSGKEVEGKIHIYPEMAAAGLWTTPTDLAKFAIELQLSLAGRSNKVLTKQSVESMTTPVLDNAGLGFFIEKRGQAIYFGHGGADEGFRAELLVSRDKGYGVAVMVNSDNGNIIREIIRAVANEYGWDEFLPTPYSIVAVDTAKLDAYVGRYQINPDRVLTVQRDSSNSKLIVEPTGDPAFELLPITDTTFVRRDSSNRFHFNVGNQNAKDVIKVEVGTNTVEAPRISAEQVVPYELLMAGKTDEALAAYRKIKDATPQNASISQGRLNNLGYSLMRQKRMAEAITIFKLNVEFYPKDFDVYDSLGEAYMTNGDKTLAIMNYKKSLELNPKNNNATQMLKKLE